MGFLTRSKPAWAFPEIIKAIIAEYPAAVAPSTSRNTIMDLRTTNSPNGLRFDVPVACERFDLTASNGRTHSLPGGTTGFVPKGSLPSGVYQLRAEGPGIQASRTVLMP